MSLRLRMSIYAVASLYTSSHQQGYPLSPDDFVTRATHRANAANLTMDELKASILLCLYKLAKATTWEAVADMGRLTRMAELYYRIIAANDQNAGGSRSKLESEELRTVWWCIYSLDTFFSAMAIISHAVTDPARGNMTLPNAPVPDLSNPVSPKRRNLEHVGEPELSLTKDLKLWETMTMLFSRSSCRGRSLHIGACAFMRSVTDLRLSVKHGCGTAWKARFRELESDFCAATLSLPVWVFNPSRDFSNGETEREHRDRLETLFVWQCACLLHAGLAIQLDDTDATSTESIIHGRWQNVIARANEVLHVAQNWKPDYFEAIDAKSAYIIFVTGIIFTLDHGIRAADTSNITPSSHHIDLILLFLGQIGRYWPLGMYFIHNVFRSVWHLGEAYADFQASEPPSRCT
ncbi:hypothetical protein PFICI_02403 [Pestalotiopsis fici W106-1]|uniref:Transcription factor domain-containing protein n=1 Tax=Pestalotiopsis fici (strain W106-1 / CGMCC3.15140) TaxID=1229662 RepID=W3XE59_PESFW|nr:uncharacterized protein PFICI_02403 [Pestalotiopsis fici W106-1]ETS84378.1 hypothetical protein PFICI_02403 [Pestalotiopsis fici W106-1]